jgi:spectinomycin phosphotransferase
LTALEEWTGRYLACAAAAGSRGWVATHGETHTRNQVRTAGGIRFVDWESLMVAPPERDLSTLVQAGYGGLAGADPEMVLLFDLEWRLSEIDEYVQWFSAPHAGTADDAIAFDGLLEELSRDPWWNSG